MHISNNNTQEPIISYEPVTILYDEGNYIHIQVQLPGIAEEKIKIDLDNQTNLITIMAFDKGLLYKKTIILPCEVRFSKKRFFDEILEISLEKFFNNLSGM